MRTFCWLALGLILSAGPSAANPALKASETKSVTNPPKVSTLDVATQAAHLRDKALRSNEAYAWLSELTTRFGARPAGSASERNAALWAAERFKTDGFSQVRLEPFDLSIWTRGEESASVVSPYPQTLVVTALGGSQATPSGGLEAEAVFFETYAGFLSSKVDLKDKIVVVLQPTTKTQTGIGYGLNSGSMRRNGPLEAKKRGAVAFLMRSLGTESHRFAHAGATRFQEGEGIPAMAMSTPDAENFERMLSLNPMAVIRLKLLSRPTFEGVGRSQNVIAELKGTEKLNEVIVVGGHMDSWDLGTGAIDDGAGMAITMAAVKLMIDSGLKPKRTIRVVLYGAEEVSQPGNRGLSGAQAYADTHVNAATKHIVTAESDFGADVIYAAAMPVASDPTFNARLGNVLYPLGIYMDPVPATSGGPDTVPSVAKGVPVLDLQQNGMDYFDTHHTADDVLERVDPTKLSQNVAAWAATLWMIANEDVTFTPVGSNP